MINAVEKRPDFQKYFYNLSSQKKSNINTLPFEVIQNIFRYLNKDCLNSLLLTSFLWNVISLHHIHEKELELSPRDLVRFDLKRLKKISNEKNCPESIDFIIHKSIIEKALNTWYLGKVIPLIQEIFIESNLNNKGRLLLCRNSEAATILHKTAFFANSPELFQIIFNNLSEKDRVAAIQFQDKEGRTMLHIAAQNSALLKVILDFLPEKLTTVQAKDKYGQTVLHLAVNTSKSLQVILDSLAPSDRCAALSIKKTSGETVLHTFFDVLYKALFNSKMPYSGKPLEPYSEAYESLQVILNSLPEKERLAVLQAKSNDGDTVLERVNNYNTCIFYILGDLRIDEHLELLRLMLESLPAKDRLLAVHYPDKQGRRVIHRNAEHEPILRTILASYPIQDRLAVVLEEDPHLKIIALHRATNKSIKTLFELLAEKDRLPALEEFALSLHDIRDVVLEEIISLLPEEDQIALTQLKLKNGKSILHQNAENKFFIKKALSMYPAEERLSLVLKKDTSQENLFFLLPLNLVHSVINSLPEHHRIAAFLEKDNKGNTILHKIESLEPLLFKELIQPILNSLPEKDRLAAVQAKDSTGKTILHQLNDVSIIKMIIDLLPEQQRLTAIFQKDDDGKIVLHKINGWNSSFSKKLIQIIFNSLPEKDRLAAVQAKDNTGKTILHQLNDVSSIKMIIDLLPEQQRLTAIFQKDDNGKIVLHKINDWNSSFSIELIQIIFNSLPEKDRLTLILAITSNPVDQQNARSKIRFSLQEMEKILDFLPLEDRFAGFTALLYENEYNFSNYFNTLLKPCFIEKNAAILEVKDINDQVKLYMAGEKGYKLKFLASKDNACISQIPCQLVLPIIINHSVFLSNILTLLSPQDRLTTLSTGNSKGLTLLHQLNFEQLKVSLAFLNSQHDKFIALQTRNGMNETVLELAAIDTHSVKELFDFLDESDKPAAIQFLKNNLNKSVTWKEELKLLVKDYIKKRLEDEEEYTGIIPFIGYSKFEKKDAVSFLLKLLDGHWDRQDKFLAVLSDGKLGETIRLFLKENQPEGIQSIVELLDFYRMRR